MTSYSFQLLERSQLDKGYVVILPGIEGRSLLNRRIVRGLRLAEVPFAIEIDDWTCGWPWMFYNLRSKRLHQEQAQRLAEKIVAYQQAWPRRPVWLIGHSGGGALTLETLAQLPGQSMATGAVLLGPAISPRFDCRAALRHVSRGIWNFCSLGDFVFLGLMTSLAGSVDGYYGPCAGMVGFPGRNDLTLDQSEKLQQVPYRTEFLMSGNLGGHFGFTSPAFVKKWVAPLLLSLDVPCAELAKERLHPLSGVMDAGTL